MPLKKQEIRKCKECGKEFIAKTYHQVFCSAKCKQTFGNKKRKPFRKDYIRENAKRIALRANMRSTWYKFQIFKMLGNKCARCGETDWRVLQIDHVNGGGTQERLIEGKRRGNAFYRWIYLQILNGSKKYQLLCANCNWKKRYENEEKELGRQFYDVPHITDIWKALEEGKDGIEWKGKKFLFHTRKSKTEQRCSNLEFA